MKLFLTGAIFALALSACSSTNQAEPTDNRPPPGAQSQNQPDQGQRGPRGGKMPEAALTACASLSEGASCSFETERGTVTGMCKAGPRGEAKLACVPEGGRPGGQGR